MIVIESGNLRLITIDLHTRESPIAMYRVQQRSDGHSAGRLPLAARPPDV